MKVSCQQCGAAYSVADSKVAGRKVKLRCKQCDEAMIIDGTTARADAHDAASVAAPAGPFEAAAALEPSAVDQEAPLAGGLDDWHIAVGDQTQGPYSFDEVARYYAEGHIGADTLVYRDGASDWQPASEIAELTSAAAAFAPPPRPSVPPPRRATPRSVPVAVGMGSDPFDDYAPAPVSKPLTADDMLSSTRHEGTVQFSLDQIRAISSASTASVVVPSAVVAPSVRPAASSHLSPGLTSPGLTSPGYTSPGYTSPGGSVAPGYAAGEGSGLIDVSALVMQAQQQQVSQHEETPFHVISSAQRSPLDIQSSFGSMTEARGGVVDFRTKVLAGLTAFGVVVAAAVVIIVLANPRPAQPTSTAGALTAQAGVVGIPAPAPAAQPASKPAAAPAAAEPAAQAAAEPAAAPSREEASAGDEPAADKARPRASAKRPNASGKRVNAQVASAKEPKEARAPKDAKEPKAKAGAKAAPSSDIDDLLASAPAKKPAAKGNQSIDDLLDSAVSAKKQPPKAEKAESAASGLPMTPSRDDMRAAYSKATAKASKCKGTGVANADVTIAGSSGRATRVNVSGVDGAAKSCVETAVKSTPFPKFQKDSMQVKFPFKLGG
jgi:predicted Zn finger-like uncharacterized protein